MAEFVHKKSQVVLIDKRPLQKLVREQNLSFGIEEDASATPEKSQALTAEALSRNGLRPEDNIGSCSILASRERE